MLTATVALTLLVAGLGVPPLSDAQQTQLETARDDISLLDEGALYALLDNVARWPAGERLKAEAADGGAIREDPAAWRGTLVRIEGMFVGQTPSYRLSRPGPWGEALPGWGIMTGREPPAVIVYFVDPEGALAADPPGYGSPVQVVGRFYKRWTDTDSHGRTWRYLTFIARSPQPMQSASAAQQGTAGYSIAAMMLMLVAVLLFILWRVRAMLQPASTMGCPSPRRTSPPAGRPAETDPSLPASPAEALGELARRSGERSSRNSD